MRPASPPSSPAPPTPARPAFPPARPRGACPPCRSDPPRRPGRRAVLDELRVLWETKLLNSGALSLGPDHPAAPL